MNPVRFVHLKLHTEFSIVDGLVRIKPLVSTVAEQGMPAVAITDQTNMFGLIKFYTAAMGAGVKPICGCDLFVRNPENPDRSSVLTLLVRDGEGYRNLTELISRAYTGKTRPGTPWIEREWVAEHSRGLIALSGGMHGELGQYLLDGEREAARRSLQDWMQWFPDSFYLELQRCGRNGEEKYLQEALLLASEQSCPVVATNDVRFLQEDDFEAHEVRVCIHERRTLGDPRRSRHYTPQQYLKSPDEMAQLFSDIPEAIENTVHIARRCTLDLELDKPCLPNYPVPAGLTIEQFLEQVSRDGLSERMRPMQQEQSAEDFAALQKTYFDRLAFELDVINQMGFPGYFLIVMEFIQWAKDNDIPVGPGRGSGAGSIVAWALKITDLDPMRYDLLFERFLNPERVSMPDFDVDFCMDGRDRVIQHVAELYGKDAVSQIITFGTMAAKAVVRDVARVQGKSYGLADKLSKLIPFEPGMTLKKAMEQEPQLPEFIKGDEDAQEIMDMAFKLEGLARNVGKHAGGVVIAPTKLTDFSPLYCDDDGEGLVTQYDKNDVETAGLVKFDFLGLRTLTIIDWAVDMIGQARQREAEPGETPERLDINTIPLDDPEVFGMLQRAETTAVFQLESRGMKELIRRLLPSSFEDIVALVALFRPGPLQSGMVDDFINRKHGRAEVNYPHPDLEPVLSNTYGVILYQEQVMQIAQVLANYSLGGADMLRRAMGKKKAEEMQRQREIFREGAMQRGLGENLAMSIFDLMEKFAGYGFNKSHSAAYALVSYQTAWLKTHYPACYMAAVLSADMQQTDKVVTLIEECRQMQLPLVPPDVNTGAYNFTVNERGEIVYGLGAIKGLGEGPIRAITEAREAGPFETLMDFCSRIDLRNVNRRALEALVRAGALDSLEQGDIDAVRARLMATLADTLQAAEQANRNQAAGVVDLFGEIAPPETPAGPEMAADTRPWTQKQRLSAEKETLGLYLSGHPIDEYLPELDAFTSARLAELKPTRGSQTVAGLVVAVRTMRSKRGEPLAFVTLDDRSGRLEVSLPPKEYEQYREYLHSDTILVLQCSVSVDDYSGGMRGRASAVMSLDEARQAHARQLQLRLTDVAAGNGLLGRLEQLLSDHRMPEPEPVAGDGRDGDGDSSQPRMLRPCPVSIEYSREALSGRLKLGPDWSVRLDEELLQSLRHELGEQGVRLEY